MPLLGTTLTIWMGPTVPVPLTPPLLEGFESAEVTATASGRSGFALTFRVGRGQMDVADYGALLNPQFSEFSRVLLMVTFNAVPEVLIDGFITDRQLSPGEEPGTSTLTVMGEDVSVMMDLEEKSAEHPAQPEMVIALKIIATYARYGLIPMVLPPPSVDMPLPIERIPVQQETDLAYLRSIAERFGYVFHISPGPAPLTSTAYWGPPERIGIPQRALSVNMGVNTNVTSIDFDYNALALTMFSGNVRDRRLNTTIPVRTVAGTRVPLVSQPAALTQTERRVRRFRGSGLDSAQAFSRAQGETDRSTDEVVTARGELDALRYEALLRPRGIVGLRGAGYSHDGLYFVKEVAHSIREGSYTQRFTLTREGTGSITPAVIP